HLSAAARAGRALTDLDPFGRGGEQRSYLATGRGGFSSLICVESQPCFGNALVEVVSAPRSEKEAWLVAAALSEVGRRLEGEGIGVGDHPGRLPGADRGDGARWLPAHRAAEPTPAAAGRAPGRAAVVAPRRGRLSSMRLWTRRLGDLRVE